MRVLVPEAAETTVSDQLSTYDPGAECGDDRPHVAVNFVTTLDGHATIAGRAGGIGSPTDLQMLLGLRSRFGAVMVGAATMRAERYGRLVPDPQVRAVRERRGLPHDPLAVLVTNSMDLPWDAKLFTSGGGRILIFTGSDREPEATATSLRVVRHPRRVDLPEALRHLRQERGLRSVLCEGGPDLFGQMLAQGLVDELFLTISPKIRGGQGLRILEGELPGVAGFELEWLLEADGELFARYARR